MWTEVKNQSWSVSTGNSSKMVDPDLLTQQLLHTVQQKNASTAAATGPSHAEDSLTGTSGIIPGAIAATVFIAFLLGLYALLWKCMVSPPQRKPGKVTLCCFLVFFSMNSALLRGEAAPATARSVDQ